jgi:hypothetical protein
MSSAANDRRIDHIEFPAQDSARAKEFYAADLEGAQRGVDRSHWQRIGRVV